jgi:putative transposase
VPAAEYGVPVLRDENHVQLRYNYRAYLLPAERSAAGRALGCARVAWNDALAYRKAAHEAGEKYPADGEVSARLTALKATPEREWLNEVSSVVLQQSLADLGKAYRAFFASLSGKRKGPKAGAPRFKSRKDPRQPLRFTASSRFRILEDGRPRLPKIGDIEVRWSRELPAAPTSVTLTRDAAGRYFVSFVVEAGERPLPETGRECGIDLGLTHFAVMDDGTKIAAPKLLRRAGRKLRKAQRDLSRKQKGSANRNKARVKVARAHAHVAGARRDFATSSPRRSSAKAKRCTWRTSRWRDWGAPGWPSPCMMPDGPRSRQCRSTRRRCTAASSGRSAGGSRPARSAQRAK